MAKEIHTFIFRNTKVSLSKDPYNSGHQQQEIVMHTGIQRLKRSALTVISRNGKSFQNKETLSKNCQVLPTAT